MGGGEKHSLLLQFSEYEELIQGGSVRRIKQEYMWICWGLKIVQKVVDLSIQPR